MIPLEIDRVQRDAAQPLNAGVRVARLAELDADDRAAWAQLSRHSGADSLFASDWFVRAVLEQFDPDGDHRLFIAVDALGEWYGVAVLTTRARFGRLPLAHWCGLANPNQFMGVPLVRTGREAAFWRALLAALDWHGDGRAALCLSGCPADHRVTRALLMQCKADGRPAVPTARVERAALLSSKALAAQATGGLSSKRRSRLRSLERKLERDYGAARCVRAETPVAVEQWIADFLALEAAGWKGRNGSALACSPATEALFSATVRAAHARDAIVCLGLEVGGRTIAMSSFLLKDGHGFGFKCCFDEDFASYAPGILLIRRIMDVVSAGPDTCFDSCSSPDEVTINGLWPERRTMLDLSVMLHGPLAGTRFMGAMAARRGWHWWKQWRR